MIKTNDCTHNTHANSSTIDRLTTSPPPLLLLANLPTHSSWRQRNNMNIHTWSKVSTRNRKEERETRLLPDDPWLRCAQQMHPWLENTHTKMAFHITGPKTDSIHSIPADSQTALYITQYNQRRAQPSGQSDTKLSKSPPVTQNDS
jgi:hypothetical protein